MTSVVQEIVALLAITNPLGAVPGAITTVLTLTSRAATWREIALLLMAVIVVGIAIGVVLASGARLGGLIGYRGQRIFLRFMGLILAAVGAEVLLLGIHTFAPGR